MRIYSIFPSISGEVDFYHQGRLTTFIRFSGCPLRCTYCDTKYAWKMSSGTEMTVKEIMKVVDEIGIPKVTITGGEPLMQAEGLYKLTRNLTNKGYDISVETNGSFPLLGYGVGSWVVDYKLPTSGEQDKMNFKVFQGLRSSDFVKFVIKDIRDFEEALRIRNKLKESNTYRAKFAFSPVHGEMDVNLLINWLLKEEVYDAIINVQLHKVLNLKEAN